MIRSEARSLILGAIGLLLLGVFVALNLKVTTDITHFLPGGEPASEVQIAKELAGGELSRTMVLLIDAESTEDAVLAGARFEAALRAEPRVASGLSHLDGGPPEGIEEALWTLYHPHRFAFFARDVEAAKQQLTEPALREAASRLKEQLASPLSSLISRVAPEDPTLILPSLLERLEGGSGNGLSLIDGRFITEDGKASVLFLSTSASSTNSGAQRPILAGIHEAFNNVARNFDTPIALSISGANRFAVRAEEAIKADISRVSIGSGVGLALLLLLLFRSFRLVLLVLPVISAGFLAGMSACLAIFGSVHGLTLAFGAAMIGVSIDYAVHFHCHQTIAPHNGGPRATLKSIWSGLSLGAATTIIGFVALLTSDFPGLREFAVFATAGIFAALMATRVFLPGLAIKSVPPKLTRSLVASITSTLANKSRFWLALPSFVVIAITLLGLPKLSWNDGIADLNKLDPDLLAEDEAVRERVVSYEQGRLVVAIGANEEEALRVNDRIAAALEAAQAAGELSGSRSLAVLLPSSKTQRDVDAALRNDAQLWPRMRGALAAEGFVADGFLPFRDALAAAAPEPLLLAELRASPLEPLVRPFRVSLGEQVGIVSFLHELRDESALTARLDAVEGAHLIDIEGALTRAYGTYRGRMLWLSLFGLVAVLALVALRHRAVRPTLTAFAPALLAALGTVAIISLAGLELNVLSLVALLMVVSMGVDYGVFLTEAEPGSDALEATHLAVFVAGTSTLLGFGLLAFSDQPPLFSIGLTAGIGVSLCFILAPTLNALIASSNERA